MPTDTTDGEALGVIQVVRVHVMMTVLFCCVLWRYFKRGSRRARPNRRLRYSLREKIPEQVNHLDDIIHATDVGCINNLRMNRNAFGRLCVLLKDRGGLVARRGVSVPEQVAIFLSVIAHHKKNRIVKHDFKRSGRTISLDFNRVLKAVLRCHDVLVAKPDPVPPQCNDQRWKWFEGCLGALDGTYIPVRVADCDKGRYRCRKGMVCVNVLGVCDRRMNFIYVLTGWEGSSADGRVLREAMMRANGFTVPRGYYYLCDAGYTNGEGFLAPFRGTRYHLKEWGPGNLRPQNPKELFNLRHARARNIIERCFGLLKTRWAILRSHSYYSISVQNQIVMACCLLHNYIRMEMSYDPAEDELSETVDEGEQANAEVIDHIQPSQEWTDMRWQMANTMFNEWIQHP